MFETWEELEESIKGCNKCKLCKTRQNIVFGVGNKNADIMFIGEGPGARASARAARDLPDGTSAPADTDRRATG